MNLKMNVLGLKIRVGNGQEGGKKLKKAFGKDSAACNN